MSQAVKRRRGTTAQHASFTGLEGELTVDTDKETVVVHDGTTAGGFPLQREDKAAAGTLFTTISPAQLTANTNDWAPTGHAGSSMWRVSTDASRNLTGIASVVAGRILTLHNVGAFDLVLKDEDVNSAAANRFALPADVTLGADAVAVLQYDGTTQRWRVVSGGGGSGVPADGSITYAKIQDVPTDTLLGRDAAGAGPVTSIALTGGLEFDGADGLRRAALTGDVTAATGSGATVFRNFSGVSVLARSANSVGAPADLAASADNQFLARRAGALAWSALAAADISDFDTQVRTSRLDQMAAPTASVSLNSQLLTNVLDPVSPQDAATKSYVDALLQGLSPKKSARVATAAAGTLASSFENGDTVDGVVLATGDRILIKDQAAPAENGIYTVNASGAPTRAVDFDANAEVEAGAFIFIEEGTANADSGWVLTTDGAITIGTTALAFVQFSGAGQIINGFGLLKSGNTLSVNQAMAPTWTAAHIFAPSSDVVPIVAKASASQTADLLQVQSNGGTPLSVFDAAGRGFTKTLTWALALGTPATTGTNKTNVLIVPRAGKIVKAWIVAKTGPTGAALITDINLNGTSIWNSTPSNRVQIAAGDTFGSQTSFDTTTVAEGDQITIDVDQIGSTIAGQDVTVQLLLLLRNT